MQNNAYTFCTNSVFENFFNGLCLRFVCSCTRLHARTGIFFSQTSIHLENIRGKQKAVFHCTHIQMYSSLATLVTMALVVWQVTRCGSACPSQANHSADLQYIAGPNTVSNNGAVSIRQPLNLQPNNTCSLGCVHT